MTVRIAQISDLHVSVEKPAFVGNMHRILDAVRAEKPDLLLNTGDLGLFGERDNGDLALALEAHRELGLETRFLPGNHDVGEHPDIPDRVWVEEASLDRYRSQAGPDFWTLDLPGWRLVGLNSLIVGPASPATLSSWRCFGRPPSIAAAARSRSSCTSR